MERSVYRRTAIFAAVLLALTAAAGLDLGTASRAEAADLGARHGLSGDLFYNYYAPPGCGGVGAELYLCPRPTPPLVGHTYVTYPPLLPHEFLYKHHRTYHRKNGDAGWTKTRVHWN